MSAPLSWKMQDLGIAVAILVEAVTVALAEAATRRRLRLVQEMREARRWQPPPDRLMTASEAAERANPRGPLSVEVAAAVGNAVVAAGCCASERGELEPGPEVLARRLMRHLDSHGYPPCGRRMTRDGLRVLAAEMDWDLEEGQ